MEITHSDLRVVLVLLGWLISVGGILFRSGRELEKRDNRIKMLENQFGIICKKVDRLIARHEVDHDLLIKVDQKLDDIFENCIVRPKR